MFTILWTLVTFILALTILIGIHEFGHFITARMLGVKVLRFSIGFGKALLKRKDKSGTEYVIASVPLGGYVKMLDENEAEVAPAELPYAFNRQAIWKRVLIVAAGPVFNILFAIVAYWLVFVNGITDFAPIIGQVANNSIASQAGLQPMDEIIAIQGHKTNTLNDVNTVLIDSLGNHSSLSMLVKNTKTQQTSQHNLNLKTWTVDPLQPRLLESLGITFYQPPVPTIVDKVLPNSPAEKGGLKPGDKIIVIQKQAVTDWNQMRQLTNQYGDKTISVTVLRDKQAVSLTVTPALHEQDGQQQAYLGIESLYLASIPSAFIRIQHYSLIGAIAPALKKTWDICSLTFNVLYKMLIGKVSIQSISGPVGVAQGAGLTASIGLSYYLDFLATVSISLGILNILPLPILDGGHLLYFLIEAVRGKPVSNRTKEIGMRLGIILLLALAILAFFNDLQRILS